MCVSGLSTWFLKSFVDKSYMYCFLLVVQGKGTIGGEQVCVGSYMTLQLHDQLEVGGDELLTVVLHFLPAACGHRGQCPEVPEKLQEVLTSKDNGMQECRVARKRWLQHTYDERRRKPKQHLKHELGTEVPVSPGGQEDSPCGQDPCHPEQQDGQLGAERTTAPQSAVVKAEERNMDPAATSMVCVSTDHMATGVASERFHEPLRGGCDEIPEATRVASEETRVPSQVVHRVWMSIKNGTLDMHGEIEKLPSVAEKSLASFAFGFRQMLWTWQSAPVADRFCHCERRNAQFLMPAEEVRRLLRGGVHVAQIKDIIQMRILFAYGGFFVDLDVMWLGLAMPTCGANAVEPSVLCVTEPDKDNAYSRKASLVDAGEGVPRGALGLSVMHANKGSPLVARAAGDLTKFWTKHAAAQRGQSQPWMSAATIVSKIFQQHYAMKTVCVSPLMWCPLPRWITAWDSTVRTYGYDIPSSSCMKEGSVCVNVWCQQWPVALQTAVCEWCMGVLDDRLKMAPHVYPTPDNCWATRVALARALGDLVTPLTELLGDNVASHRILADVNKLLRIAGANGIVHKIKKEIDYGAALIALILVMLPKYSHETTCCTESLKVGLARVVGIRPEHVAAIVPLVRAWVLLLVGQGVEARFLDRAGSPLHSIFA